MSDTLNPMNASLPQKSQVIPGIYCLCAHLFWTYPMASSGPYLLVIDIGQDPSNDLQ